MNKSSLPSYGQLVCGGLPIENIYILCRAFKTMGHPGFRVSEAQDNDVKCHLTFSLSIF